MELPSQNRCGSGGAQCVEWADVKMGAGAVSALPVCAGGSVGLAGCPGLE